ncbi:MAG: LTA synthase family protein, partial [Halarsenatibacteraceae bacterium]
IIMIHIFNVPSTISIFFRNLAFILFILYFIFPFLEKKSGRIFIFIVSFLFTFIFMSNLWYNRYFGNYLSVSEMTTGEGYNPLGVLFRHIFNFYDPLFIIDLILMGFTIKTRSKNKLKINMGLNFNNISRLKTKFIIFLIIIIILMGQVFITNLVFGGFTPLELYNNSTQGFVNVYGFMPLYAMELVYKNRYENDEEHLKTTEIDLPDTEDNILSDEMLIDDYSNIIVIQVESLDKKAIDYNHNDKEVVPFINSIKEDSLYGNKFYAQHVNGSFDADFSMLTGMYPVNRQYSFRENDMTEFPSLVNIMNELGYSTLAFHGNDSSFFHRHEAYPELGFDKFYSREDYSMDNREYKIEDNYLGINDYDFLKQSVDFLEKSEEPFFAYFITVTSHTPFRFYPEEFEQDEFEDLDSQLVKDFFNSLSFVDHSIEMFFEELEKRDLDDDTLFIIYSDHEASIETEEYSSSVNFNVNKNVKEPEQIPFIIKHSDIENKTINKTGTVTDIAPTILDILGINEIPDEFMGHSMMQPEDNPVLFIHEIPQVLYQDQLFVNEFDEFIKIGYIEGEEKNIELNAEIKELLFNKIRYSRDINQQRKRED